MDERTPPALPPWLEATMPFSRRVAVIDGAAVHFVDHGEGPATLLVHGNPAWSFLWRKVIRALPGQRAIAPDLVGFGLSDKPRSLRWHTVERHVQTLIALVDGLGYPGSWLVAGQDWGGPIGLGVARHLDARGKLAGLLLGNTAVLPPRRPVRATSFHQFSHLPLISELAFVGLGFPVPWMSGVQAEPGSIGRLERRAYRHPFRRWRDRAGPLALARMVPHRDGHPSVPLLDEIGNWALSYRGPVSLVWGRRDPILARALRRHQQAWPHATVREVEAGHFLQEEVPEVLAEELLALRERAASS
jgi:pimeloyl-ACP methyl ester carboxylesterase